MDVRQDRSPTRGVPPSVPVGVDGADPGPAVVGAAPVDVRPEPLIGSELTMRVTGQGGQERAQVPRVLVAVVLDQDSAGVHWPSLEDALRAQQTSLVWDILVLDTTEIASPNYAGWLTAIKEKRILLAGQRSRVRRLSDPDRGEIQAFSDPAEQLRVGSDSAFECFIRWRSYAALWIIPVTEPVPAPEELQQRWDGGLLYRDRPDVVLSDENDELSSLELRVIEESDILTDEGVALAMAKRIGLPLEDGR